MITKQKETTQKTEKPNPRNEKQERLYKIILECRGVTEIKPKGERSERAFAKMIGMSFQTIQNLRNGRCTPSDDFIAKVARYKGIDFESLRDYIEYGKEPTLDPVEEALLVIRRMYTQDLIKVFDTATMRLADLEKRNHPPNRI